MRNISGGRCDAVRTGDLNMRFPSNGRFRFRPVDENGADILLP